MAVFLVAALTVGLVTPADAAPTPSGTTWSPAVLAAQKSVPGHATTTSALPADQAAARAAAPPAVTWPAAGSAEVAVTAGTAARAGKLPVRVAPARSVPSAAPSRAKVQVLDRASATRAGVDGVLLRVERADRRAGAGKVSVQVDYSGFAAAYGGDWATRLRIVRMPACVLTTPDRAECRAGTPVDSRNDAATRQVTADVDAPAPATTARTAAGSTAAAEATARTTAVSVLAVAAVAAGSTGDYKATSLAASATAGVSAQTGDYTWTYPLKGAPGLGGPTPDLTLSYSSGSVDGRTASTNNQPSWVGEGFELAPGYIERKYVPCADDGVTTKPGDLCWRYDNATMVLNGHATELIRDDATGTWRPKDDDGSRVEKLASTATNNGDNDGEHWRVTTLDGTQYYFGYNRLPGWVTGKAETNSAWTVPVFGNNSGEPCYQATYANAWCWQAYRWNLDYVVDPHGNAQTLWYQKEFGYYGRNKTTTVVAYIRGGWLSQINYGLRSDNLFANPPARFTFTVAERCLPSGSITCDPAQLTTANAKYWPDTPFDQNCASSGACTHYAPTFWSRKRLTVISAQTLTGTTYTDVDTWTLRHLFPTTGDATTPSLWLSGITHTGKAGGTAALPEVGFGGIAKPNRVDGKEGIPPLNKFRIAWTKSESGAVDSVNYSGADCVAGATPTPDSNTRRCFPSYWTPEGALAPQIDWFHKYVVTSIVTDDRSPASTDQVTSYEYVGNAAWHYDDDGLTPDKYRSWSQWRGYEKVRVTAGVSTETRSQTEYLYLRGMDGDRTAAGGTKSVSVVDSTGAAITDAPALNGFVREETVYNGPGGAVVSTVLGDAWTRGPTARQANSFGTRSAYMVRTSKTRTRAALAAGGYRRMDVTTTFNDDGLPVQVDDSGDTSTAADDRCTRTSYARNTSTWLLNFPAQTEITAIACDSWVSAHRPDDVVSAVRNYYDGSTTLGAAPTKGELTRVDTGQTGATDVVYQTTAQAAYDVYGRPLRAYDAANNKTTTAYTPATGGPVTSVVTTNPLGHTSTAVLNARGQATTVTDANSKVTTLAYDPLGRLTSVWKPGRTTAQAANLTYAYLVQNTGVNAITTKTLNNDGTYTAGYQLLDGLLRTRQMQSPAPGTDGGRTLTDTIYDSRGFVSRTNAAYFNSGVAGTTLLEVEDNQIPIQVGHVYDGAGRETATIQRTGGVEQWRTTTVYGGDRTTVTPPLGATPATTLIDARGNATELRQYRAATPTGAYDTTRYGYDAAGRLTSLADPAGNTWRYAYDLHGNQTSSTDPDRGATTYTYDALDRPVTSTDARGATTWTGYDALSRKTELRQGSATGTLLAAWTYDTLAKGQPVSATRYVDGQAYTQTIKAYDNAYRVTSSATTIPTTEGALAGTYTYGAQFNTDDTLFSTTSPAAGGLPAETLRHTYDNLGLPNTLSSSLNSYVTQTTYTKLSQVSTQVLSTGGLRVQRTWGYEQATGRLSQISTDRESLAPLRVQQAKYSYDQAGNITGISDAPPALTADNQCFRYDYLRRLTEAWTPSNADCATAPTTAALSGPAPYWQSYTYDVTGNRTTDTVHTGAGDTTRTYTYPAAGQARPHALTSVTTGGKTSSYGYDQVGNTTSRPGANGSQTLAWDVEGHLSTVTEGTSSTGFLYDAGGERLIRREPTATTLYLDDLELRLDKASNTVSATRYYTHQASGTIASRSTSGGLTWLLADDNGTATLAINPTTTALTQRRHTPFGGTRGTAVTWPTQRGYVGGTDDATTGLTHLGAREYDNSTGRFVSVDPILDPADPQQTNGYSYADNSPVTNADPTGELCTNGPDGMCNTPSGSNVPTPGVSDHQGGPRNGSPKPNVTVLGNGAIVGRGKDGSVHVNVTGHGDYELPRGNYDVERLLRAFDEYLPNYNDRKYDNNSTATLLAGFCGHPEGKAVCSNALKVIFDGDGTRIDLGGEASHTPLTQDAELGLELGGIPVLGGSALPAGAAAALAKRLNSASIFKGPRLPPVGGPSNGILIKRSSSGTITNYATYDKDGRMTKRVHLNQGDSRNEKGHADLGYPHTHLYETHVSPTGIVRVQESGARKSLPEEIP